MRTASSRGFCHRLGTLLRGSRSLIHVSWVCGGLSGGGQGESLLHLEGLLCSRNHSLAPSFLISSAVSSTLCHLFGRLGQRDDILPSFLSSFFQPPMRTPLTYISCWSLIKFNCFCSDLGCWIANTWKIHFTLAFGTSFLKKKNPQHLFWMHLIFISFNVKDATSCTSRVAIESEPKWSKFSKSQ